MQRKNSVKSPLQNVSPPGACTWKIILKYKLNKARMLDLLPTIRLAQLILKHKFSSIDKPTEYKPLQK